MSRAIGYARVSTTDQKLELQREALEKHGCAIVLEEFASGTRREGREQLDLALKVCQEGDTLVVTRLDRLGRSLRDLANIAHELEGKGIALRVLDQAVDTSTSAGKAFFGMLAVFAQFETDVRAERQREGITRAKAEGKYKGRPPSVPYAEIRDAMASVGARPSDVARAFGVSRMSVYRALQPDGDS